MWPTRIFLVASATNDRVIAGRIWIALPIETFPDDMVGKGDQIEAEASAACARSRNRKGSITARQIPNSIDMPVS